MFCCVRTRGRKEGKLSDPPAVVTARPLPPAPPAAVAVPYRYDDKSHRSTGNGIKDGNMVMLTGAGAAVGATVATVAVVDAVNEPADRSNGTSQGCCCGGGGCGGDGGGGGGCGGCGGCGG